MLQKILEPILNMLFPREKETQDIEHLSANELLERCSRSKTQVANFIPLFYYKDALVRKIIWEIKYKKNKQLAFSCAELTAKSIDQVLKKNSILPNDVSLVPIPISSRRLRKRGYSQTELVAERIQKFLPYSISYVPNILKRTKDSPSQTKKTATERRKNIKGCFSVIDGTKIKNKVVIVFDDVVTTGATIEEAYNVIKKYHPRDVFFVTLAH